jgi:hypothetical protein
MANAYSLQDTSTRLAAGVKAVVLVLLLGLIAMGLEHSLEVPSTITISQAAPASAGEDRSQYFSAQFPPPGEGAATESEPAPSF